MPTTLYELDALVEVWLGPEPKPFPGTYKISAIIPTAKGIRYVVENQDGSGEIVVAHAMEMRPATEKGGSA
jgi:hypothetical protein